MSSRGTLAEVPFFLELEGASSPADLELRAIPTHLWGVLPVPNLLAEGVVPDSVPVVLEYVSKGFEVALAGVDLPLGSDAHMFTQVKSKPNRNRMDVRAYPRSLEAFTEDHLLERVEARTPIRPRTIRRAGIKKPLYMFRM